MRTHYSHKQQPNEQPLQFQAVLRALQHGVTLKTTGHGTGAMAHGRKHKPR